MQWACYVVSCSKQRYLHDEETGTEANPGKSWFTSHSRAGLPEWDGEINHLNYLYYLISLCIAFICFLNPAYSWICVSYLCKPQLFCTSFNKTHYIWIFHGLLVIMGLMFLSDYTFHEVGAMSLHLITCCGPSTNAAPGTVFLSGSIPNVDTAFHSSAFKKIH